MAAQIGYYDTLKSVAGKVFAYLSSITLTGTDGKTLTLTGDATISETPPLNANVMKGDGVAGRVVRTAYVWFSDAAEAAHIKMQTISNWNGDSNGPTDNIGKDAVTTGVFSLNAGGTTLTWLNAGINGDAIAVLSSTIYINNTGTAVSLYCDKDANGITFTFYSAVAGAAQDMTTLIDGGSKEISTIISYITSA